MPDIEVIDGSQHPSTLTFTGGKRTLLYVLSPMCGWCKRNQQNANALATAVSPGFHFIGISLVNNNLDRYLAQHPTSFPVYTLKSTAVVERLQLGATPQLLDIDEHGTIQKVWTGAFDAQNRERVEAEYKVKLPGLTELALSQ